MSESPAQTRSQRKRAAILGAAMEEFLAQGFRDTSMDRIAERANVSKRTVYNHFESKDVLFQAIAGVLLAELDQALAFTYDADRSLEEQLTDFAYQEVDFIQNDLFMGIARVLLAECFSTPDLARDAFGGLDNNEHPLSVWIKAAADDDRLVVNDTSLATGQFNALLKGSLFWPAVIGYAEKPGKKETDAIVREAVNMFLDRYRSK